MTALSKVKLRHDYYRQTLVTEVHRRVLIEYLRAIMRGRIICTSLKMRKKMASRLRDEGRQFKGLFKDLVSNIITIANQMFRKTWPVSSFVTYGL